MQMSDDAKWSQPSNSGEGQHEVAPVQIVTAEIVNIPQPAPLLLSERMLLAQKAREKQRELLEQERALRKVEAETSKLEKKRAAEALLPFFTAEYVGQAVVASGASITYDIQMLEDIVQDEQLEPNVRIAALKERRKIQLQALEMSGIIKDRSVDLTFTQSDDDGRTARTVMKDRALVVADGFQDSMDDILDETVLPVRVSDEVVIETGAEPKSV